MDKYSISAGHRAIDWLSNILKLSGMLFVALIILFFSYVVIHHLSGEQAKGLKRYAVSSAKGYRGESISLDTWYSVDNIAPEKFKIKFTDYYRRAIVIVRGRTIEYTPYSNSWLVSSSRKSTLLLQGYTLKINTYKTKDRIIKLHHKELVLRAIKDPNGWTQHLPT